MKKLLLYTFITIILCCGFNSVRAEEILFKESFVNWIYPSFTNGWDVEAHGTGEWDIDSQSVDDDARSLKMWSWQIWPYDAYIQISYDFIKNHDQVLHVNDGFLRVFAMTNGNYEGIFVYINGELVLTISPSSLDPNWTQFDVSLVNVDIETITIKGAPLIMSSCLWLDLIQVTEHNTSPPVISGYFYKDEQAIAGLRVFYLENFVKITETTTDEFGYYEFGDIIINPHNRPMVLIGR